MKELYEKFISAYKQHDEGMLSAASLNLVANEQNNPFDGDSSAHELFFKARNAYIKWQNGGIDARRSRERAKEYMAQIAALDLPNPYPDKPKEEVVKPEEPQHIFGVVSNPAIEEETAEEIKEETKDHVVAEKQEQETEKRPFFGKRKK